MKRYNAYARRNCDHTFLELNYTGFMPPVNYSSDKKSETDIRSRYIDPALFHDPDGPKWNFELVDQEHTYTDGEIVIEGRRGIRKEAKKPDYVLLFESNYPAAIIEAKWQYKTFKDGMGQAIKYAKDLRCNFAYSTNGKAIDKENNMGIYEYDFTTKQYNERGDFPSRDELLKRDPTNKFDKSELDLLLKPLSKESSVVGKPLKLRYYQENAVNLAFSAILEKKKKILLNLATGTGKTQIAFQIARKVWSETIDENGNHPKILYSEKSKRKALVVAYRSVRARVAMSLTQSHGPSVAFLVRIPPKEQNKEAILTKIPDFLSKWSKTRGNSDEGEGF